VVFAVLALATARAQVITPNPNLPVVNPNGYYTNGNANVQYNGPGFTVIFTNVGFSAFDPVNRVPSGPNEIETFNAQFTGQGMFIPFGPIFLNASGPMTMEVFNKIGNTTGTFNTEMLSMTLTGVTPFGSMTIRESPTLASAGVTTVTNLGDGLFRIDSFFDVFTELSLDGGNTWIPDSNGPDHVTLVPGSSVPEPTVCALAGLAAGLVVLRRSRWFRKQR
jgi:hypothetical protein